LRGLWVAGIAGLFDEALEALVFEIEGLADDGEAPAPFVQVVVMGGYAITLCSHVLMFGSPRSQPHSAISLVKQRITTARRCGF
jgi:hypothetical protein